MKQSFTIPDAPSASMFSDLIYAYTERASHLFDSVFSSLSPFLAAIKETPAYKQLLDIFDLAGEGASHFVEEFGRIVEWVDEELEGKSKAAKPDEDKFSAFEVKGLAEVEKAYGRQSEQYITAAKSMQAVLSNVRPRLQIRDSSHQLHSCSTVPAESTSPQGRRRRRSTRGTSSTEARASVLRCIFTPHCLKQQGRLLYLHMLQVQRDLHRQDRWLFRTW